MITGSSASPRLDATLELGGSGPKPSTGQRQRCRQTAQGNVSPSYSSEAPSAGNPWEGLHDTGVGGGGRSLASSAVESGEGGGAGVVCTAPCSVLGSDNHKGKKPCCSETLRSRCQQRCKPAVLGVSQGSVERVASALAALEGRTNACSCLHFE